MTIEAELRAAVARADTDSRLLHEIVHGDGGTIVTTEGGPVKSVARAIGDVAIVARDVALESIGNVLVSEADTTSGKLSVKLEAGRGLEAAIADAGAGERLALSVTPHLSAGALVALAEAFI